MNIVNFWEQQIAKWNEESKCDMCWSFHAPLTDSALNITKLADGEECCTQVFLLRNGNAFSTTNQYNESTGFLNKQTCNVGFQLLVVIPTKLGVNNWNEIIGHPTEESNWATKLWKLEECLSCDANLDFCEILGANQKVTTWSAVQKINHTDNVYAGYLLTVNFQTVK